MKRLGIFCTYDPDGIIDEYIVYLLKEMRKVLSYLVVVCNGKLTPEGRDALEKYSDEVFVRENVGFDMEAWRQGILRKKDTFDNYDELVIFNDSFYGPIFPFEEMFAAMYEREPEVDFWGITVHGAGADPENLCPYGYVPEHIQSYFLVVRSRLFHSKEFFNYWETAEIAHTFSEAVKKHEVCITKHFFDMGFRYAAYCDTRDLEKDYDIKFNPYIFFVERLLNEYRCPVIKKRIFYLTREMYLRETYGTTPRDTLTFIRNNTNYNVSLIIKNILRKLNIATVKACLGLNYIFPTNLQISGKANFKEAVIVAHLYYEDLMPECVKYLCNAPKEISIVITVSTTEKKQRIENLFNAEGRKCEVRLVEARGRDLSALYVGCADLFHKFKYLCFIHDKKSIRAGEAITNGEEFFHMLWRNVLSSEIFIRNTLITFEEDPHLGILSPPPPHHGRYGPVFFIDRFWSKDHHVYESTLELADRLKIPRNLLDINVPPLTLGNVFWCRTEALKIITDKHWKIEDFPKEPMPIDGTVNHALERILAYAAQVAGFYTGWIINEEFAKDEIENFIFYAVNNLEIATSNAEAAKEQSLMAPFVPPPPQQITLTNFVKSQVPQQYWFLLKPVKKILEKMGFNP